MQGLKPRISVEYLGKVTEKHNIAYGIVADIFFARYSLLVARCSLLEFNCVFLKYMFHSRASWFGLLGMRADCKECFIVVRCSPPPSVNGGAACLLSSCVLPQIVGGASRAPYHSFASRIPYGPT